MRIFPKPFDRFFQKIESLDDCWIWGGARNRYGFFEVEGKNVYAHRYIYTELVGEIPDGLVLDHLCSNTYCANPDHLEPVTQYENVLRGNGDYLKYRTECLSGHTFNSENTRVDKRSWRVCKACQRDRVKAHG